MDTVKYENDVQKITRQMTVSMAVMCSVVLVVSYFVHAWWMVGIYLAAIIVNVVVASLRVELKKGEYELEDILDSINTIDF